MEGVNDIDVGGYMVVRVMTVIPPGIGVMIGRGDNKMNND